jgi:hypothetical protein
MDRRDESAPACHWLRAPQIPERPALAIPGWQVECHDAIEIGCKHENCRVEGVPDPNSDKLRSFTNRDASL